jgi:hypothetical protein
MQEEPACSPLRRPPPVAWLLFLPIIPHPIHSQQKKKLGKGKSGRPESTHSFQSQRSNVSLIYSIDFISWGWGVSPGVPGPGPKVGSRVWIMSSKGARKAAAASSTTTPQVPSSTSSGKLLLLLPSNSSSSHSPFDPNLRTPYLWKLLT